MTPTTTTTAARSGAATASTPTSTSTSTPPLAAAATATAATTRPLAAPGVPPLGALRFRSPALRGLAARACRGRSAVIPGIAHACGPRRGSPDLNHASRTGPAQQRPLRDAQPRAHAHHRGRSGEAVLEYQPAAHATPCAVDEQAAAVGARTAVDDEPAGVDEGPVPVRTIEEGIVETRPAAGPVVDERIVARAVGEAGAGVG